MREIVSPLDGFRSPFGQRRGQAGLVLTIVGGIDTETDEATGITTDSIGTYAVIGEHPAITFTATVGGSPVLLQALKWSNSSNFADAATCGTGTSPTDIAALSGSTLYLHGQYDGEWTTRSVAVRYRPGTLPAFSVQSFADGVGGTYQHPVATGTGLTWTYAQVSAISGVTYNAGTRTFTFASSLPIQSGTAFGASAVDQYGRAALGSPRTSTFSIAAFVPAVITELVVTGVQNTSGVLPVGYTIDVTTADVAWGIGTGSAPTAAALRAGTGMLDFGTVTLMAGSNTFNEDIAAGINSSSLNLWMVTPGSSTVVTATAAAPGVVPFALDTVAPTVSFSPADGATNVSATADLIMTFSKAMKRQGTVDLRNVGGSSVQSFNLASAGTWSAGDTVWTGNPSADFASNAALCVRWSGLADTKNNLLADNAGDTQWNFTAENVAFSPASLFAASEQGGWYDPSDLSTLFQDAAGTVPVTADNDPVRRINDKSGRGNHLTASADANRPLYKTSGGLHWLEFDGTNDCLFGAAAMDLTASDKVTAWAGLRRDVDSTRMFCEHSVNAGSNTGTFYITGWENSTARYGSLGRGSTTATAAHIATMTGTPTAPDTCILTVTHDIAGDLSTIARNRTAGTNGTGDKGTGNMSSRAFYIGARGNSSLYFQGRMYGLIVRGGASTSGQIADAEAWIAAKTGVTL